MGELNRVFKDEKVDKWIIPQENDIFFCHPGNVDQELRNRDSVVDSRIDVLEFLKSNDCMEMMRREDVKINTFSSSSDLRAT